MAAPYAPSVAGRVERRTTATVGGTIVTVSLGELLIQLGLSPVTAVLPGLSAAVGVSASDGAWILTVFILALAGTLLVSGRLGDLLGHRRVFGVGALIYAVASGLGGLAPTFEVLLAGRLAQGLGAAMVSGNNLAILARAVPVEQRARAIAIVATVSSVGGVVGAGLGTAAVAYGSWQVLFLALVPLGLWAAWRARRLPISDAERERVLVDWPGAALLMLTITLVAIALNHPHTATSEVAMPVFHTWLPALAILAAGAFVAVERRVRVPLLDWTRLRNSVFAAAIGVNFVLHLNMLAGMFLGPLLVVRGLGLDTVAGGMLMVIVQASLVSTAYLGGWLYDRTRSDRIRPLAAAVLGLGTLAWALAGLYGGYAGLAAAGLLAGLGSGILLAVNNTVIMGSLPPDARGVASGMLETTRHFGHAFGVTIPTAILAFFAAGPGASPETQVQALRLGFFWACLVLAASAAAGVILAMVRPKNA
jgi:MFS family permease